jgi:hypothetical protein
MARLVFLATWFALTLGLAGCGSRQAPAAGPSGPPSATLKADALLTEYGTNAVAADTKYKGKVIEVSGKFSSASKAPLLGYAVQLLPEDAGDVNTSYVQCFIVDSAQADVAELKPGDKIRMRGTCDGQVLGQVKLSQCIVVK